MLNYVEPQTSSQKAYSFLYDRKHDHVWLICCHGIAIILDTDLCK